MYEIIGALFGILIILFLLLPLGLGIYMWNTGKTDIDHDGL